MLYTMVTHVGTILKNERERQNISLEDVEKATRIRTKNLIAIEDENWDIFPSRTYVQGIIKRYSRFLNLSEQKLLAYFRRDYERHENIKFKKRTAKEQFTPRKKRIIQAIVLGIVVSFAGFFGYQVHLYLKPPEVIILEPHESTFKRKDKITLKGQAPEETIITVNDTEVLLDDKNIFEVDIPLVQDINPVTIVAVGANGKKTVIERVLKKEK